MQAKAFDSRVLPQCSMNFQAVKITDLLQSLAMAAAPAPPEYSRNDPSTLILGHLDGGGSHVLLVGSVAFLGGTLPFN